MPVATAEQHARMLDTTGVDGGARLDASTPPLEDNQPIAAVSAATSSGAARSVPQ